MKPADILRRIAPVGTMGAHERVCAALLDECERVLALELDHVTRRVHSPAISREAVIRATLAKLRGEA